MSYDSKFEQKAHAAQNKISPGIPPKFLAASSFSRFLKGSSLFPCPLFIGEAGAHGEEGEEQHSIDLAVEHRLRLRVLRLLRWGCTAFALAFDWICNSRRYASSTCDSESIMRIIMRWLRTWT